MNITRDQIDDVVRQAEAANNKAKKWKEKGEEVIGRVARTVETGVCSFGFGYLAGRKGDVRIMGAPVALVSAAALHLGGFFGVFGKYADHAHNLGDGGIAAYTTILGVQIGTEHKQAAGQGAAASGWATLTGWDPNTIGAMRGLDPRLAAAPPAGVPMTMDELMALAQSRAA